MSKKSHTKEISPGLCPWKWLGGVLVLIVLMQVVDHWVGWPQVAAGWKTLNLPTASAAFGFMVASHLLRAFRIHWLLKPSMHTNLLSMTKLSALHQFTNNLLPMRMGEVAFPILMKRYFGVRITRSIPQLIWLRALDLTFMALISAIVIFLIQPSYWLLLPPLLFILLIAIIWMFQNKTHRRYLPPMAARFRWAGTALTYLFSQAPRSAKQNTQLLSITAISWLCKLVAACLAITLFAPLPLLSALAAALAGELSGILPIHGIAGSGSFEAAFFAGLSLAEGVDTDWLGVALNTHIFLFSCTAVVALISLAIPVAQPTLTNDPCHDS